ncbi:MAG: aldehyde ferredoxin oxidoreductase family protein [Proteobacteria bacterium]|nr:aldehyde ferredoxin oxidoreductase family protein [Pseudomonadota bacterium]
MNASEESRTGLCGTGQSLTGWTGRILSVDLSTRKIGTMELSHETYATWIGGKGLAGFLLRPQITLAWDNPFMPIIFMTGPLVGTIAPTSGRGVLMTRSPLTGTVGDSSFGGALATQLKRSGWDGVVITGQSEELVGIEIKDAEVQIVSAEPLRGLGTEAVFRALANKGSVACIGPAGENGSLLACVMVDRHHAAGRGGLGASLGAKQLKYLSVSGTGRVAVADRILLKKAREDIVRLTMASPALMGQQGFACFGTGAVFDLMDARRMMPTDNFRSTHFSDAGKVNAFAYRERYQPEKYGCKGCHIQCKKVRPGVGGGERRAMPEFETMSHFTALIGNTDMDLVLEINALLNDLGIDTIGAGATLACYREIDRQEKGHRVMDASEILELLQGMAQGPEHLGGGSRRYATAHELPWASMSVKGQELSAYDPRGAYGMALAYATSTRGGCHLRAYPISHEILRKPVATDRFTFSGKARIVKIAEDTNAVVDSLTACKFIFFAAGLEEYARAYSAVTGLETTAQDLLRAGERIYFHDRVMNGINGFSIRDDDLPMRFFSEAGSSGGGVEIKPINRKEFYQARERYYRIRGLDERGKPLREKADELGVAW